MIRAPSPNTPVVWDNANCRFVCQRKPRWPRFLGNALLIAAVVAMLWLFVDEAFVVMGSMPRLYL